MLLKLPISIKSRSKLLRYSYNNVVKLSWRSVHSKSVAYKNRIRPLIKEQLVKGTHFNKANLIVTLYPYTKHRQDLDSGLAPVIKAVTDILVSEFKVLPDDNYKIIPSVLVKFGRVDNTVKESYITYELV